MRAGRKLRGLNQTDLCAQLGISQSYLSKVENGLVEPNVSLWFNLCDVLKIGYNAWREGFIDLLTPASLRSELSENNFKLPSKYAVCRGTKVRALRPLLQRFEKTQGKEALHGFLKERKIDPDFFTILDNQVNFEFFIDLTRALIQNTGLDRIHELTSAVSNAESHGTLREKYDSQPSPDAVIYAWVGNARYYDCDFRYRVEDDRKEYLDISITPEEHLENFSHKDDALMKDFILRYQKSYLENLVGYQGKFHGKVTPIEEVGAGTGMGRRVLRVNFC